MRIATVFWRKHRGEITALACQGRERCLLKLFVHFFDPLSLLMNQIIAPKDNHCFRLT